MHSVVILALAVWSNVVARHSSDGAYHYFYVASPPPKSRGPINLFSTFFDDLAS